MKRFSISGFSVPAIVAAIVLATSPILSQSQMLTTVRVAFGLSRPLFCGSPPGDLDRLFIVEQITARIKILKNGSVLSTPFLDIDPLVIGTGGERGLLGLAFHPNYAQNGYFFVNYINNSGNTVIARYQVSATNPDVADPTSGLILLTITQPFSNHNGGMLAFGPDGYLYIGMGDGGSGGDPQNNAQTLQTLLGKMLRIDVDNPAPPLNYGIPPTNPYAGSTVGRQEIWAKGLRNPFRFSFDRATRDMYIGDVGQSAREEISFQPGDWQPSGPGSERNYGWRCREGVATFNPSGCPATGLINPIYDYPQGGATGWCITGGYVYRGCAIPGLEGTYFFADYTTGNIWSFRYDASTGMISEFQTRTSELAPGGGLGISSISSFGEDAHGELYICDLSGGEVFKIVPRAAFPPATLTFNGPATIGTTLTATLSSPLDPNQGYVYAFAENVHPPIDFGDGRLVPLAMDSLLLYSLDPQNGIFLNNYGNLDSTGSASIQVAIPNDTSLIGHRVYASFAVLNTQASLGTAKFACASGITIQ